AFDAAGNKSVYSVPFVAQTQLLPSLTWYTDGVHADPPISVVANHPLYITLSTGGNPAPTLSLVSVPSGLVFGLPGRHPAHIVGIGAGPLRAGTPMTNQGRIKAYQALSGLLVVRLDPVQKAQRGQVPGLIALGHRLLRTRKKSRHTRAIIR